MCAATACLPSALHHPIRYLSSNKGQAGDDGSEHWHCQLLCPAAWLMPHISCGTRKGCSAPRCSSQAQIHPVHTSLPSTRQSMVVVPFCHLCSTYNHVDRSSHDTGGHKVCHIWETLQARASTLVGATWCLGHCKEWHNPQTGAYCLILHDVCQACHAIAPGGFMPSPEGHVEQGFS